MANSFAKKTVIITLLVVLAGLLVGYLYFIPDPESQTGLLVERFSNIATVADNKEYRPILNLLSNDRVVSAVPDRNKEEVLYYEEGTGRTFRINLANQDRTEVSKNTLPGFVETIWSPDRTEVVSVFNVSNKKIYRYYNFKTKTPKTLPRGIESLAFSPDGNRIVYFLKTENEQNKIIISKPDGSNPKEILNTRVVDFKISWPNDNFISLYQPGGEGSETLYTLSLDGQLEKEIEYADGLNIAWSPGGDSLLYSKIEKDGKDSLFLKNKNQTRLLGPSTTASWCDFGLSNKDIFCAVLNPEDSGTVGIYKINADSLETKTAYPEIEVRPKKVFISAFGNYMVIVDRHSQLYSVPLN